MESSAGVEVWLWSDQAKDRALLDKAAQQFGWDIALKPPSEESAVSARVSLSSSSLHDTIDHLVMMLAVVDDTSPRQVLGQSRDRLSGEGHRLGRRPRRWLKR